MMKDQGIPHEPDVMNPSVVGVFHFPTASPKGAVTRNDITAIEQLEIWLSIKDIGVNINHLVQYQ